MAPYAQRRGVADGMHRIGYIRPRLIQEEKSSNEPFVCVNEHSLTGWTGFVLRPGRQEYTVAKRLLPLGG
jgi:hypothetical protein